MLVSGADAEADVQASEERAQEERAALMTSAGS